MHFRICSCERSRVELEQISVEIVAIGFFLSEKRTSINNGNSLENKGPSQQCAIVEQCWVVPPPITIGSLFATLW